MDADPVSKLLDEVNAGDQRAFESLVTLVYGELRRMAGGLMRGQPSDHTLQPTALVNEAYLRLVRSRRPWDGRAHFFGAAARAMRQVLIAHARSHAAQKRNGGLVRVTFHDLAVEAPEPQLDLLALDEALAALERIDPRFTRVMELRYFAGCSLEEIADLTGRSLSTIRRDWTFARAWLYEHMTAPERADQRAAEHDIGG